MSNKTRTQLQATAVGLGMSAADAKASSDDALREYIAEHSGSEDVQDRSGGGMSTGTPTEGQGSPGEVIEGPDYGEGGDRPNPLPEPGDGPIKLKDGHIVIMLKDDPNGQFEEGELLRAVVNPDGTVDLFDADGKHLGSFDIDAEDMQNTGVKIGDYVMAQSSDGEKLIAGQVKAFTNAGRFALVCGGIASLGSQNRYGYAHDDHERLGGVTYSHAKLVLIEPENLVGHWPVDQPWRLTDEAWHMLSTLASIDKKAELRDEAFYAEPETSIHHSAHGEAHMFRLKDNDEPFLSVDVWVTANPADLDDVRRHYVSRKDESPLFQVAHSGYMPMTWFIADPQETEEEGTEAGDSSASEKEGPMKKARKSLKDIKGTPDSPTRKTVPSDKIREMVEETLADSEGLHDAVKDVLMQYRDEFRAAMNIDEDFKQLGEAMLDDIVQAFEEYEKDQNDWRRQVEQKMTSKIEFSVPDMPTFDLKDPHHRMPDLLFNMVMRMPTVMVGPSGSGKTTAAMLAAEHLDLPFGYLPMGPTQTESKFAGYTDASGHYIPTEFYYRYRYGGVMLLDEMDASHPGSLLWVNGAIANKKASFPRGVMTELERARFHADADTDETLEGGGTIDMHPDCVIVAAANTFGKGADLIYQGRNALDGATLKRFKVLHWDYDLTLERKMSGDDEWVDFVQAVRESVYSLNMEHIVSPVDSKDGARMLAAGADWEDVATQTVFAGLKKNDIDKIVKNSEHASKIREATQKLIKRQKKGA